MITNFRGVNIIKEWEGLRLKPYRDPVGLWTVGYGHLIGNEENLVDFKEIYGEELTQLQVDLLLQDDIESHEKYITQLVKVPLSLNQFSALSSFVFNLGGGNFAKSTLLKELNKGNYGRVPFELIKWVKAGGKKLQGLVNRREDEINLFCTPDFIL